MHIKNKRIDDESILKTCKNISELVTDFLILKCRHEGRKQDKDHQTLLGGAYFYFTTGNDQQLYISSNLHPSNWNAEKIKQDIYLFEKQMYVSQGIVSDVMPV